MLMAAARPRPGWRVPVRRLDHPGQVDGRDVTIIDAFEAVGACLARTIGRDGGREPARNAFCQKSDPRSPPRIREPGAPEVRSERF
jgi:hypothetical protein